MKMLMSIVLSILLIINLTACSERPFENLPSQESQEIETAQIPVQEENAEETHPGREEIIEEIPPEREEISTSHERTDIDRGLAGYFGNRYNEKFSGGTSVIHDEFLKYLDISGEEYRAVATEYFGEEHFTSWRIFDTGLMEHTTLFWKIIIFDIPDEVIIDAIRINNEYCMRIGGFDYLIFTDEDIAALLTRCEETVTAQFATEAAIVIGNKAFSPSWINLHSLEEVRSVGITPRMIEEKMPVWGELAIPVEIRAFEDKLSEFVGRDVVLADERVMEAVRSE